AHHDLQLRLLRRDVLEALDPGLGPHREDELVPGRDHLTARKGSGSLKMLFPFTATDSTQAGLMIARSASRLATAKMPSAELTAKSVTGLPPAALRRTTLGWNHSGTGCSAVPPHISDAISRTRRERVTLGLMAGVVLVGILVPRSYWICAHLRASLRGAHRATKQSRSLT